MNSMEERKEKEKREEEKRHQKVWGGGREYMYHGLGVRGAVGEIPTGSKIEI